MQFSRVLLLVFGQPEYGWMRKSHGGFPFALPPFLTYAPESMVEHIDGFDLGA
jgi:hypothetical protein